jgi:hypothetical protein
VTASEPRRRVVVAVATASLVAVLAACLLPPPSASTLLADEASAPAEIREACALTSSKCSRCHTIDRVLVVQVTSPRQWETYVARMRRMSGSGISEAEGQVIVRCLVYRSFGPSAVSGGPRDPF